VTPSTKLTSIHWWRVTFLALLMLGLAVLWVLPAGSVVWATPKQSPLRQTIPTVTPTPFPDWIWVAQAGGNPVDYAPSGMPDFDQKQSDWHDPAWPVAWTHCGPLAVADVLWWLDSASEPGSTAPPEVSDGHSLLTSFGTWDDHDIQNVIPLVNELASCLDTNGVRTGSEHLGTDVSDLASALRTYLADKDLQESYDVTMTALPSFEQLLTWVQGGDVVVLLLGFWEWQGDRWVYLGGHYVAVAGAEPVNRFVAISDPFRDAFEAGQVTTGRSPVPHPYPHEADVHNDAQYVSQDAYRVVETEGPGGTWALGDYVPAYEDMQNFTGQNLALAFESYGDDYGGGSDIAAKVGYAIVVCRRRYTLYLPIILKGAR